MEITHINSGEVKFGQKESIINYGDATITTYNLVNCIAIGGRFNNKEGDLKGIFFTHESPTDKETQKAKLQRIKDILKDDVITDIYFFRIAPSHTAKNRYSDGSTTEDIIAEMISFTRGTFGLEPNILTYLCDIKRSMCGIASISVEVAITNLEVMTMPKPINSSRDPKDKSNVFGTLNLEVMTMRKPINSSRDPKDKSNVFGTFEPNYLKDKHGVTIIECPICGEKSGSLLILSHAKNCPNKDKKANVSHKPSEGGSRNKKRKTYKSSKKSQRRIKRHSKVRSK